MRFKEAAKALALSLRDVFRENYLYHSGALTYHFILFAAPLTAVLVYIISLSSLLDIESIELLLNKLFPQYTSRIMDEIIQVQRKGTQTSIVALGVSYIFSVGFLKSLSKAFSYVSESLLGGRREVFYWLIMPVLMIVLAIVVSVSFFASVYMKIALPERVHFLLNFFYVLSGALVALIIYASFLKRKISPVAMVFPSLVVSLTVLLLQSFFTWYVAEVFKGSLLYGSLSAVVAFMIWMNMIFLALLLGARLIYRLENP